MKKDFDKWNEIKKRINDEQRKVFCNQREIWWCSIGANIGVEIDGKNELFERPVIILKVFNRSMIRIAPLTGKIKTDKYHVIINFGTNTSSVILSQIKTISSSRLSRKIGRLEYEQFRDVVRNLTESLI